MLSKRKLLSPLFRLPIDAYNDGEVSFSLSPSAKRRLEYTKIREEFSDDETDDICNDSDATNVKKSIIRRIFGVIFYVLLFPLVVVRQFSAKTFKMFKSIFAKVSQRWQMTKNDYNAFMSTDDANPVTSELFTDDDDDDDDSGDDFQQRLDDDAHVSQPLQVPGNDRSSFFQKVVQRCTNSLVFFKSFVVPKVTSAAEESWIEVVIIRRIVRIFRYHF